MKYKLYALTCTVSGAKQASTHTAHFLLERFRTTACDPRAGTRSTNWKMTWGADLEVALAAQASMHFVQAPALRKFPHGLDLIYEAPDGHFVGHSVLVSVEFICT